jgi:Ca2+-binding RTX toxin-like protein
VPATGLGNSVSAIGVDDAKPAECAAIVVTSRLDGGGTLAGTAGSDLLLGSGGADDLTGAGGDDCIVGGAGADTVDGGPGTDVCVVNAGVSPIACETVVTRP